MSILFFKNGQTQEIYLTEHITQPSLGLPILTFKFKNNFK